MNRRVEWETVVLKMKRVVRLSWAGLCQGPSLIHRVVFIRGGLSWSGLHQDGLTALPHGVVFIRGGFSWRGLYQGWSHGVVFIRGGLSWSGLHQGGLTALPHGVVVIRDAPISG